MASSCHPCAILVAFVIDLHHICVLFCQKLSNDSNGRTLSNDSNGRTTKEETTKRRHLSSKSFLALMTSQTLSLFSYCSTKTQPKTQPHPQPITAKFKHLLFDPTPHYHIVLLRRISMIVIELHPRSAAARTTRILF